MNEVISTNISVKTSNKLLETAEFLLENINDEGPIKCPNRHAYILSVAAFMEARLNEAILDWGEIFSSIESGVRHAKSFLSMNLRAKLDTIFFIYTNGAYLTNLESKEYQALVHLISIRNQVAHSKPFSAAMDIEFKTEEDGSKSFKLPDEFIEKSKLKVNELSMEELSFLLKSAKELDKALDYEQDCSQSSLCKGVQQKNPADR